MDITGLASLAVAFVLSSVIGFEQELRQRSAGLRTHALVGVGAALFTLAGWHGFGGDDEGLDASRVASQVVTGIGFIGAGVIFLRRDGVRGLTTAATIWLTAAVGLAAGAGLWVLAAAATAMHLIITMVYTPLVRRLPSSTHSLTSFRVTYEDGQGILRDVMSATTISATRDPFSQPFFHVGRQPGEQELMAEYAKSGRQALVLEFVEKDRATRPSPARATRSRSSAPTTLGPPLPPSRRVTSTSPSPSPQRLGATAPGLPSMPSRVPSACGASRPLVWASVVLPLRRSARQGPRVAPRSARRR